jgi:hypothetical protein
MKHEQVSEHHFGPLLERLTKDELNIWIGQFVRREGLS